MKYVKTFSIFENERVNEAVLTPTQALNTATKTMLKTEVDKLDDAKKEALKADLAKLALKLKLKTVGDLQDVKKVGEALVKAGLIKESFAFDADDINEGLFSGIKNWWNRAKATVYKWMIGVGASSTLGGILTMAISNEFMPDPETLRYMEVADPNAGVIIGGVAACIGLLTLILGLKGDGSLGDVASGAAAGRR